MEKQDLLEEEVRGRSFRNRNNTAAKLQLTNKAFNFHLRSFLGLSLIVAASILILNPIGRHLPQNGFSTWLIDFSAGLAYGTLLFQTFILLPVLVKLRRKMNSLIKQLY
jgi:hypothetical protein